MATAAHHVSHFGLLLVCPIQLRQHSRQLIALRKDDRSLRSTKNLYLRKICKSILPGFRRYTISLIASRLASCLCQLPLSGVAKH